MPIVYSKFSRSRIDKIEGKVKMNDNNTQYYAKSKREDGTQELLLYIPTS